MIDIRICCTGESWTVCRSVSGHANLLVHLSFSPNYSHLGWKVEETQGTTLLYERGIGIWSKTSDNDWMLGTEQQLLHPPAASLRMHYSKQWHSWDPGTWQEMHRRTLIYSVTWGAWRNTFREKKKNNVEASFQELQAFLHRPDLSGYLQYHKNTILSTWVWHRYKQRHKVQKRADSGVCLIWHEGTLRYTFSHRPIAS